jgi:2-polyprenyl-6-hydroxyphenyl methylase/3-demethylubiquinone-9 3-methyltransferase
MTIAPGGAAAPHPASQAIRYHDALAEGWTRRYASGGFKRRADFFTSQVLPKTRIAGEWIDVGCGSGFFSRILASTGANVVGVDGSAAMIAVARAFAGAGPTPRYEVTTVEALSRAAGVFDGALLLSVMEYLDDPAASLGAVASLLRPGGTLLLSAPNRHSGVRLVQRSLRALASKFGSKAFPYLLSSRNAWSRRELAALAEAQGFACEVILGFDPVAPRPLWPVVSPSLWFAVCVKRT